MTRADVLEPVRTVSADINYLAPGSFINRRFVAPGKEHNTGRYEMHHVTIHDGRTIKNEFTLDTHGFVLKEHRSAVKDFTNKQEVDGTYPSEVTELVRQLTGADLVVPMGWMGRTSGEIVQEKRDVVGYTHQGSLQPPAGEAHVDMMPDRANALAETLFKRASTSAKPFKRFIASSLWRTFSPPPQDWPLAVCDARSVARSEGIRNTMIIVDKLPDEKAMLAPIPGEDEMMGAAIFRYNPKHRWWYFSNMTRDEVLLFKFHDSDLTKAMRVPHTAFNDTSLPGAYIRQSIEFRTIAYFT